MSETSNSRAQLRSLMRATRLALSHQAQAKAAQRIISPALELIQRYQAEHIAFYLPFNGEISPLALIDILHQQGKKCYLPRLHPFSPHHLLFLEYQTESELVPNRFGILEPRLDLTKLLPLEQLEMIFVPLVACDKQHNRLGMGGGFYDRTLALAPQLISVGLAHRCQQVEQLPTESWDRPLTHLLLG